MAARRAMWGSVVAGMAVALGGLAGCPTAGGGDTESEDGGRLGQPCTVDEECAGAWCVQGTCAALPNGSSGPASSSSRGSSSAAATLSSSAAASSATSAAAASSSAAMSSSAAPDAGLPDAALPHGRLATDPSTGPIEFSPRRLGVPVQRAVQVRNSGDAALDLVEASIRSADAANPGREFTPAPATGTLPQTLAPGASVVIRVTYVAADGAEDRAFLHLLGADGEQAEVELHAAFTAAAVLAVRDGVDAVEDATAVDFGAMPVGSTADRHLYVLDLGAEASVLRVTAVRLEPATGTPFTVQAGPLPRAVTVFPGPCEDLVLCAAAAVECVGGLCLGATDGGRFPFDAVDVKLSSHPAQVGGGTAEVVIEADVSGTPVTRRIPLTVSGEVGHLSASPASVDFPETFVGRESTLTLDLLNAGTAPLSITSFTWGTAGATPFHVRTAPLVLPAPLEPGGSASVQLAFAPTRTGSFSNVLRVNTGTGAPLEVPLSANAADEPSVAVPANLDFGEVYAGTTGMQDLVIRNNGLGPLTLGRVFLDAPGTVPFAFAPEQLPGPVAAGGTAVLHVSFQPLDVPRTADQVDLVLESNDPTTPTARVRLRGLSVRPVARVDPSPPTVDFGPVLVGNSVTRMFTVHNDGFGSLRVDSSLKVVDGVGAALNVFHVTADATLPAIIQADGATVLTLVFTPMATTALSGSLHVATSDPQLLSVDVSILGGGGSCTPRANATVQLVNGICEYTCLEGFHACGDACVSSTSVDSCGGNCSPCVGRSGALASCEGGVCSYTCASAVLYDIDGDRNLPQAEYSNGCEYTCATSSPSAEQCNDLDDDCNGVVDDGLPQESPEPPADCSGAALSLGDVPDNDTFKDFDGFKIYPDGDNDWLRVRGFEDGSGWCWPGSSENYETTVVLTRIPAGHDFDLQTRDGDCNGGSRSSMAGSNADETITIPWSGSCGSSDERWFYIRVAPFPSTSGAGSCQNYRVRVKVRGL